ncbi:hypothetical protein TNCT_235031 [Trichonephila clavata]|uniref:Uncharacterized protein n=1 Tax=Trichonephila clavata TaxID=2740835 RepID=A0A8X6HA93_TRICU|nr:hypothetical protein TNCT_235031 [Trichonephila clavata]
MRFLFSPFVCESRISTDPLEMRSAASSIITFCVTVSARRRFSLYLFFYGNPSEPPPLEGVRPSKGDRTPSRDSEKKVEADELSWEFICSLLEMALLN